MNMKQHKLDWNAEEMVDQGKYERSTFNKSLEETIEGRIGGNHRSGQRKEVRTQWEGRGGKGEGEKKRNMIQRMTVSQQNSRNRQWNIKKN